MMQRKTFLRVSLAVAAVLALLSVADARGFRRHLKLEHQIDSLTEHNARMREENRALMQELEALRRDPKALERAAREELGFVKPGEVVINLE